ncbi:unnamed protein product [Ranitomeya imitator]|uniref:NWD1/2-like winged helix-turn-helix domain-containing protein n=1 Tax=Ranitomeya imitator TaxID=111125 RepID=A0ABN9MEC3_9NEOB|nr:unnamed protein product [Ranitomeya imitator]
MGRRNQYHHYTLNGKPLGKSDREKDLGILVNDKLTWSSQCQAAAAKANRIMGCIKRCLDTHDESIILPLYKSLVRPHMEYCVQFWAPVLRKDIMELERKLTLKQNIIQIPPLNLEEINHMIDYWLNRDCRKLTGFQRKVLLENCAQCPLPLYSMCSYMESHEWTSYTPEREILLYPDISKVFSWLLSRLEKNHGDQVIKKTASYISLSRNGITQEELLDLLSLDQAVMDEIIKYQGVAVPVFPEVLWIKLRKDFGIYLVEQRTDDSYVINWAHDLFRTVCVNRYVKSKDYQLSIHSAFTDYYLESRSRHCLNKSDAPIMPLSWEIKRENQTVHVFNLRKILGISYHMLQSNQMQRLVTECIFNYEYLLHKAWATSIVEIQEDIRAAINPEK